MNLRVDGKTAYITGADSGIGRGIALTMAEAGANLAIGYFSDEAGALETKAQAEASGVEAIVIQGDVSKPDDVARTFEAIDNAYGGIDILVNNAGIGTQGLVVELSLEDWDRVIRTNLYGPFLTTQQAARRMIEQGRGGRIINITSVHEEACGSGGSAYNASKAGLRNLTRTAAVELGEYGITVNVIAPGMILTPMNWRAMEDQQYLADAERQIVAQRAGVPQDIANMALYLASDAASYSTGSTHYVDGGWMLTYPPV